MSTSNVFFGGDEAVPFFLGDGEKWEAESSSRITTLLCFSICSPSPRLSAEIIGAMRACYSLRAQPRLLSSRSVVGAARPAAADAVALRSTTKRGAIVAASTSASGSSSPLLPLAAAVEQREAALRALTASFPAPRAAEVARARREVEEVVAARKKKSDN